MGYSCLCLCWFFVCRSVRRLCLRQARAALRAAFNDVSRAASYLMEGIPDEGVAGGAMSTDGERREKKALFFLIFFCMCLYWLCANTAPCFFIPLWNRTVKGMSMGFLNGGFVVTARIKRPRVVSYISGIANVSRSSFVLVGRGLGW